MTTHWRFSHSDDVGPVPREGAIVELVGSADDDGWVVKWRGREWLVWWYELTPARRVGNSWRTK